MKYNSQNIYLNVNGTDVVELVEVYEIFAKNVILFLI